MSRDDSFRELSVDDPRRQLEVLNKLSLALNGCRNGNLSAAELSEERRAQMEQSISHLIYSEVSRDEISRELSVNDPRTQLVVLDKLSLVLNTYRNRLIPINRLPQDIMHHIFSIALQLENMHQVELAVSADYSLKVVDQRGRLRLVSRSWNSFVVSTPEFWSLVDTAVMDQALLSRRIERAQQRELCITHQLGYYSPTESQQLAIFLSPYLNRIRTLRLGSTYVATALLKNSFPALRTLELRGGLPLARFILVQDCFPRLCTLSLSYCFLPLNDKPFHTLRSLHLRDNHTNILSEILGFLTLCPNLEELTIWSEAQAISNSSQTTPFRLDKLRRLELRNLGIDCLLRFFGSVQIPNHKHTVFTLPLGRIDTAEGALQETLDTLQGSNVSSGSMELSVLGNAVTCATSNGRLVEVRLAGSPSFLVEKCGDTFLERLKPDTLHITVKLEDQNRFRWLCRVLERNNVIGLRVRLGRQAPQMGRTVVDYLSLFDEEGEEQAEEKTQSGLPSPSLRTLTFEGGPVDIPHLLRMVASRVNGRRLESARIQKITLNCYTRQGPDLSPSFRDPGVDLTLQ